MDPVLDKENFLQILLRSMDPHPSWSSLTLNYEPETRLPPENGRSYTPSEPQLSTETTSRPGSHSSSPIRPTSRTNIPPSKRKSPQRHNMQVPNLANRSCSEKSVIELYIALQDEYTELAKQYSDTLLAKSALEDTVYTKDAELEDSRQLISHLQSTLEFARQEFDFKNSQLIHENDAYQQAVSELTQTIANMASNMKRLEAQNLLRDSTTASSSSRGALSNNDTLRDQAMLDTTHQEGGSTAVEQSQRDLHQRYTDLLRLYRILESNFELERNAKLALIDELELTPKVPSSAAGFEPLCSPGDVKATDINVADVTTHTMHSLSSDESDFEDGSHHDDAGSDTPQPSNDCQPPNTQANLPTYVLDDYFEVSSRFQCSPAKSERSAKTQPDTKFNSMLIDTGSTHDTKNPARNSMPNRLSLPQFENREFTLSPLRLSSNNGYFEDDKTPRKRPAVTRRYSSTKPNHSRYNSHDIFPIMVEFEAVTPETLRKSSLQENRRTSARKTLARNLLKLHQEEEEEIDAEHPAISVHDLFEANDSRAEVRSDAFNALSGISAQTPLDNTFSTSLARLSVLTENGGPDPLRSHQITKLKFELQSLKLHNEKLLSYIGFELQKQNKTIKKLSKKESIRTLRAAAAATAGVDLEKPRSNPTTASTPNPSAMEYSDAKLIELSRDELINKKRVLRLVSINPILSKNYLFSPGRTASLPHQSPDAMQAFASGIPDDFIVGSHNRLSQIGGLCGDDIYGFMNVSDHIQLRRFSKGLDIYSNIEAYTNCIDDTDGGWLAGSSGSEEDNTSVRNSLVMRKCRSVEFSRSRENYDLSPDTNDECRSVGHVSEYATTSLEEEELGILEHLKHMIVGNDSKKKRKGADPPLVDDGMKLKFLTVTIGIMIIGIQFSHSSNR